MSAKILITGGTGLVGQVLSKELTNKGYEVSHLSRSPKSSGEFTSYKWDVKNKYIDPKALEVDYIIHLAGAGVADGRWTQTRKKEIYNSRIDSTRLLFDEVKKSKVQLKGFVCASAIGYYGMDTGSRVCKEADNPGSDFLSEVVIDWENEADRFSTINTPVAKVRIGVVLSEKGGALPKLLQPIKWGVGAPVGTGNQFMSWIHIDDLVGIFSHIIEKNLTDVYNGVAPQPESNADLSRIAAKTIKRPFFFPNVPGVVLQLVFGEMAGILLGGNYVSSDKIESAGYEFKFRSASQALADLLKR